MCVKQQVQTHSQYNDEPPSRWKDGGVQWASVGGNFYYELNDMKN